MKENNREIPLDEYLATREKLSQNEMALFDFLYLTGARVSEALETKVHDVNIGVGTAYIHTKKTPALPYRTVHLYPFEREASSLIQNISTYTQGKDIHSLLWSFPNRREPRIYLWGLSRKIFDCTIHSFRHTHAIQLARDVGLNLVELQAEMGWDDPGMAARYLKYGYREAIEKKMGVFRPPTSEVSVSLPLDELPFVFPPLGPIDGTNE